MSDPDDARRPDPTEALTPAVDGFGAVDPDEQPGGRRRRTLLAVGAVGVAALLAGLLVWQPWSSEDAGTTTTTANVPVLSSELVIDLPGVVLTRSLQSAVDEFGDRPQQGFIFAAPGAGLDTGPLLAFLVEPLGGGETIDTEGDTVEIDGQPATVEDNGDTIEIYWEGEPGVRYGVAGAGVTQARVIAFAESVSFEGGVTTVGDADVIDGMEPAGDVATLFGILGLVQPFFSSDKEAITLEYATEQGDTVTLASLAPEGEFVALASLVLDDERLLEVDGNQVVIGTVDESFGTEESLRVLLTVRGGRLIGITAAGVDDDGLLALLAAVRPATDDEWATVLSLVEDPMDDFLSSDEGGDDTAAEGTTAATALPDDTEP